MRRRPSGGRSTVPGEGPAGTRRALLVALLLAGLSAPCSAQETHLLVVTGLSGTPDLRERFTEWSVRIVDAARARYGLPEDHVIWLAERPAEDTARIDARSTRDEVERVIGELAGRVGPDDRLLVVLVGHGSWDGEEARLNLPGPDLSAGELAAMLDALEAGTVAVVNTASASGPFLEALAAPGRIVITATRSGRERNATEFGRFFAEALAGDGADTNRDGMVSILEAFVFAAREVERAYEERNLLLTEHAQLDDDGDGRGSGEPAATEGEGALARAFVLATPEAATVADDPETRALLEERRRLEERVRTLRARREEIEPGEYDRRLEELLLELARVNREIRGREGSGR